LSVLAKLTSALRRTWDETVAPPAFGEAPALRRLWRLRLGSAIVIAIPAHLFVVFYLAQATFAHYRTVRGTGDAEPLTVELLQLHLYDRIRRDYHHLFAGSGSVSPKIERISLRLRNDDLDRLDAELPPQDGSGGYVPGELELRGSLYDVGLRYRGSRHWNWNYPQKSWKVRLEADRHLLGHETLLLGNSPEAEPLLELVALDLARRRGLMVTRFEPVWLEVNGSPLGVYFLEAPVDESVLRHAGRFPWNIYSGNGAPVDPATGTSRLFESAGFWTKAAGPIGQESDLAELVELLEQLHRADPVAFARFAEERLDLRAFAELDALDVVLGIDQHNYDENQKLYYDPYRGVFEPVVWNLRGANHEPVVQRAPSPLVLRLSELAAFVELRDGAAWALLEGDARPEALTASLKVWDERLQDAFDQDPYWDAVDLLPKLGPYFEEMARPMDRRRQLEARAVELGRVRERNDFLVRELSSLTLTASLHVPPPGPVAEAVEAPAPAVLSLEVDGRAPLELLAVEPRYAGSCAAPGLSWRRQSPAGGPEDTWRPTEPSGRLQTPERLFPGTVRVARPPTPTRGPVRLAPAPRRFDLALDTGACRLASVVVRARNGRTAAELERTIVASAAPPPASEACAVRFEPGPGGRSLHPWCLGRRAAPVEERLGPGSVEIAETRTYEPGHHLIIEPGTTVHLGPGASLVARGRLTAVGRPDAPIRFVGERWGVIAIEGPAAAGSTVAHVELRGGGEGRHAGRHYTAMLSVHDTARFTLRDARLSEAQGENALHLVYVREAHLERVTVARSHTDGVDLEHAEVVARGLSVLDSGDDALDLMGAHLAAEDVNLLDCTDNGVSAGEQSEVALRGVVIARCPMGILVKNSSRVEVEDVVVAGARVGIRVERRSDYYLGESSARGAGLWFVAVDDPRQLVDKPTFAVKRQGAPEAQDLGALLQPRGLSDPSELVRWRGPGEARP